MTRLLVGLTGGVGSGKSTVARLLAERGAVVIDADVVAREVVAPGTSGLAAVVDRFGHGMVAADGSLDRAALARRVFAEETERQALNAILHPLIRRRTAELVSAAGDAVVVNEIPLLVENDLVGDVDTVVVVETPLPLRLARLAGRGLGEDEARARMRTQADDAQRREVADEIVVNDGDLAALGGRVDALWQRLTSGRHGSGTVV